VVPSRRRGAQLRLARPRAHRLGAGLLLLCVNHQHAHARGPGRRADEAEGVALGVALGVARGGGVGSEEGPKGASALARKVTQLKPERRRPRQRLRQGEKQYAAEQQRASNSAGQEPTPTLERQRWSGMGLAW